MKALVAIIAPFVGPTLKAVGGVCAFLIALGWGAYASISLMVKAEAGSIREEVKTYRQIDMEHINKRFDRIEELVKRTK